MFLGEDRLPVVRRMILASTTLEEAAALEELRRCSERTSSDPRAMDGLPVTDPAARPAPARVPAVDP